MRPRTKKHLEERIESCRQINIIEPEKMKSEWDRPIHLEIGCGKGAFICSMAAKYPEINFIAVEVVRNVIVMAMEKAMAAKLKNIKFISCDARFLEHIFAPGEVEKIYLNFSDPWPKTKQHKRRLTYPAFLKIYENIMGGKGEIHQKTDNRDLFDASLEYYREAGWKLKNVSFDLYGDGDKPDSAITEYEQRFMDKGQPIHRVEAFKI